MIKHFQQFKHRAISFQKYLLTSLLDREELDLKGTFLVISQADQGQIKRKENTRMIEEIAVRGVLKLKEDWQSMIG